MSRMGDWVIEMQEDCIYMDRGPWIEKYGTRFAYIYDEQLRVVAPVAIAPTGALEVLSQFTLDEPEADDDDDD